MLTSMRKDVYLVGVYAKLKGCHIERFEFAVLLHSKFKTYNVTLICALHFEKHFFVLVVIVLF